MKSILVLAASILSLNGISQINTGLIKTSIRKTIIEDNRTYLPKGVSADSMGSYRLMFFESARYNMNSTNRDWTISAPNTSWLPTFWDDAWGTNFITPQEINSKTLRYHDFRSEDKKLIRQQEIIEATIRETYPDAQLLFQSSAQPEYSFHSDGRLSNGTYQSFYDLNKDGISDVTVDLFVEYEDTLVSGINMNDNFLIDYQRMVYKPRDLSPARRMTATIKIAKYRSTVRIFRNQPIQLTLDAERSGFYCYFGFSNEFESEWRLSDRYVKGAGWTFSTKEWSNSIDPVFQPYNSTYRYNIDPELLESDSIFITCKFGSTEYKCRYSIRPYIQSGETGCPGFYLDTMFISSNLGLEYLNVKGYLTNVDPFERKTVELNDKEIPATIKVNKEIKRSSTYSFQYPLTNPVENLEFNFLDQGSEVDKLLISSRQLEFLKDKNTSGQPQSANIKPAIKWLNPSSSSTVSDVSSFTLAIRFYTTKSITNVSIVPLDNTKLTVEYQVTDSVSWSTLTGEGYTDVYSYVKLRPDFNKYKVVVTIDDGTTIETEPVSINYKTELSIRPPDNTRNLYVISVGINQYRDNGFKDLTFARKDACQIDSAFQSQEKLAAGQRIWDTIFTYLLVDTQATTNNIVNTIRNIPCDPSDVIVFFFSGHGKPVYSAETGRSKFCMITHDCKQGSVEFTGLTYDLLKMELDDKGCNSIVLLDACFSGTALNSKADEGEIKNAIDENMASTGFIDKTTLTISSCSSSELAADDTTLQNGILARTILLALGNKSIGRLKDTTSLKPDMIRKNNILDTDELTIFCRDGVSIVSGNKQRSGSARRNSYNAINLFVLPE